MQYVFRRLSELWVYSSSFGCSSKGVSFKSEGLRLGSFVSLKRSRNDGSDYGSGVGAGRVGAGFGSGLGSGAGAAFCFSSVLIDGNVKEGQISGSYS